MTLHQEFDHTGSYTKATRHGICLGADQPSYADEVAALWKHRLSTHSTEQDYLIHYARLAANSHNTQPWLFEQSETGYTIRPDFSRRTPVVDPDDHHLYASLGCAAENLSLAAKEIGKNAEITSEPSEHGEIKIHLSTYLPSHDPLFSAIINRQCTRSDYNGQAVPNPHLKTMSKAAQIFGCGMIIVTDRLKIEQILELIVSSNSAQIENPAFVKELKTWIRFNPTSALASRDGLYAPCSGNPTLPNWLSKPIFKMLFNAKSENKKYVRQIRSSSGLAIFYSENDNREHWMNAGRSYQRFALQATLLNIKNAFMNQPVEVSRFRRDLANLLNICDNRPDFVVRFGYASPMPRSLRRTVSQIMY